MGVGGTAVGTSYQRGGLMTLSSSEENGCVRKAKSVAAICLPHVRKITFISLSKHTDTHLQTLAAARVPPPNCALNSRDVEIPPRKLGIERTWRWFWFKERSLKQLHS